MKNPWIGRFESMAGFVRRGDNFWSQSDADFGHKVTIFVSRRRQIEQLAAHKRVASLARALHVA
jgi:hypothetical protein